MTENKYRVIGNEYPNNRIMHLAHEFLASGEILDREQNRKSSASIMCIAFAIELYIKSIHAEERCAESDIEEFDDGITAYGSLFVASLVKDRQHKLDSLFKNLPHERKNEVSKAYSKYEHSGSYENIVDALTQVNSAFIDWRYVYEGGITALETSTLLLLARFFKQFTQDIVDGRGDDWEKRSDYANS